MEFDFTGIPSFGVAGNFTGHLEQAGEAEDFTAIKTVEAKAPKAVFPTYIPGISSTDVPHFLTEFPFSHDTIIFPKGEKKLQIEPECAVVFDAVWTSNQISELKPVCFGASNDCSIRKEGAKKISEKKNWGKCSKGFAKYLIPVDRFCKGGVLDRYRIASFLVRNGEVSEYGEDSAVRDYSYIYEKLSQWLIEKLNFQRNEGPAEDVYSYLVSAGCPKRIMISIGATRYTDFGEHNFLQDGDDAVVILYPEDSYSPEQIKLMVKNGDVDKNDISILWQKVVL